MADLNAGSVHWYAGWASILYYLPLLGVQVVAGTVDWRPEHIGLWPVIEHLQGTRSKHTRLRRKGQGQRPATRENS